MALIFLFLELRTGLDEFAGFLHNKGAMKTIGEILRSVIGERNLELYKEHKTLFDSWQDIVEKSFLEEIIGGELQKNQKKAALKTAKHSRIVGLSNNILVVEADHTGWIQILKSKHNIILSLVQRDFSKTPVQKINFVLKSYNRII